MPELFGYTMPIQENGATTNLLRSPLNQTRCSFTKKIRQHTKSVDEMITLFLVQYKMSYKQCEECRTFSVIINKTSFITRSFTEKFDASVAHTSVWRAGRRRTGSLVSFRTKLLSHGDGKAMSRLYNSRTQSNPNTLCTNTKASSQVH